MEPDKNLAPVSYAVRPTVVAQYVGALCLLLALSGSVPLLFTLFVEGRTHATSQAVVYGGLAVLGLLLGGKRTQVELQRNEALVIVVLAFLAASVAFALFESVSGITTTGLTTIADVQAQAPGLLFTAAWLQWIGGLGIMVLAFALLFGQGVNAMRLTGVLSERSGMLGGTRAHGRIVLAAYIGLTLLGITLLKLTGLDWFGSLTLALAAVSTGGYSPYNASIGGLDGITRTVVILLSVSGAFGMLLYYRLWRREWRLVFGDPELRALWIFAALMAAGVALMLWQSGDMNAGDALQTGMMTALSAQSTTGFSVVPPASLDPTSKLLLIFSMLAGGGVGSTAGGIKLLRVLILLNLLRQLIVRSRLLEHAVVTPHFLGRTWSDEALLGVLLVVSLHLLVVGVSWLAFLPYGYDPLDALFEVVSACGTVGLSTGITSSRGRCGTGIPGATNLVRPAPHRPITTGWRITLCALSSSAPRPWRYIPPKC